MRSRGNKILVGSIKGSRLMLLYPTEYSVCFGHIRLRQTWAKNGPRAGCGPRDDFMLPTGSYKKMNRSTEDAKTFSFAPHLYFRRTQDIQWKTGYARM